MLTKLNNVWVNAQEVVMVEPRDEDEGCRICLKERIRVNTDMPAERVVEEINNELKWRGAISLSERGLS